MSDGYQQPSVSTQPAGSDLEIKSLLSLLIRRRWVILGVALPIILVSALVTLRATEKTTASARLMIIGRQPETPDFLRGNTNWDLEMSSASQVVMSLPVARLAAEALYDTVQTMAEADPSFPVFETTEDVLITVAGEVDCSQVGESNILNITFSHFHEQFALVVVKYVINAYINFNMTSQQNLPAVEYYSDQIDNLHVEIDDLFQQRADVIEESGMAALAGNTSTAVHQLGEMESSMFRYRAERMDLEARRQSMINAIAADPYFIPSSEQRAFSQPIRDKANQLITELVSLRGQFKEGSGQITYRERQLEEIWKEVSREREYLLLDLQSRINGLRQRENSYLDSILQQEIRLEGFTDVERRLEVIDVQIRSQLDLLETLEMKRGEVKLKAGADLRVSNIFPLDEPYVSMSMVGSKKTVYLVAAAILAITFGLIVGWFIDNQDHRIFDRSQAARSLDVPVLGSISSETSDPGS